MEQRDLFRKLNYLNYKIARHFVPEPTPAMNNAVLGSKEPVKENVGGKERRLLCVFATKEIQESVMKELELYYKTTLATD